MGIAHGVVVGAVVAFIVAVAFDDDDATEPVVATLDADAEVPTVEFEFMYRLPKERVVTDFEAVMPEPAQAADSDVETLPALAEQGVPSELGQDADDPLASDGVPDVADSAVGALATVADDPGQPVQPAPVTETSVAVVDSRRPPSADVNATDEQEYLLQAAAFRGRDQAEAMRARLMLATNAPTRTESARTPTGGMWHRVLVGPFDSAAEMRGALATLEAMEISALPLSRPKT